MSINRPTEINTGGVNPVKYVFVDEVSSITVGADLMASITLKSGKAWRYLYATDGSISVQSKEDSTASGMRITYQIDMVVPRDQVEVELALKEMNDRGIIIMASNKNLVTRLFGSLTSAMRKGAKLSWPEQVEEFNGTKLSFVGEFSSPAPYIDLNQQNIPYTG